jgi:hypothetical protein
VPEEKVDVTLEELEKQYHRNLERPEIARKKALTYEVDAFVLVLLVLLVLLLDVTGL